MSGPYHLALAKSIMHPQGAGDDLFYTQDIMLALSENYQDTNNQALFRFCSITGGAWPYWFLFLTVFTSLYHGIYQVMPPTFMLRSPQLIYVHENYQGCADLYVHTPQIDPIGVYAVFSSDKVGRDGAFYGTGDHFRYRYHKEWSMESAITLLGQSRIVPSFAARL